MRSSSRQRPLSVPACDACHSRKVRCDRDDPCGNCQDQGTTCTRQRNVRRLPKKSTPPRRDRDRTSSANQAQSIQPMPGAPGSPPPEFVLRGDQIPVFDDFLCAVDDSLMSEIPEMPNMMHSWISLVPLTDAQLTGQRQLECTSHGLVGNRRQALESALYAASQLPQSMGDLVLEDDDHGEEQQNIPSAEFLSWMLNDIRSDRFGPFVFDYFKHVSKPTLKRMGLALLSKTASPSDTILYTICVNGMAYKFLTTVLMIDEPDELSRKLWKGALVYKKTAQRALKKIGLLTAPSLTLLQAILCGIFLCQGSGDTQLCCELTRVACRICVDLDLNTTAVDWQETSEEKYYCVMWCYMLDRNYAWKLGRSRCFLDVDPETIAHYSLSNGPPVSELLLVYMHLAQVQDGLIPFLRDSHTHPPRTGVGVVPSFDSARERLFRQMEDIRRRIDQIASVSHEWKGLDASSEISALDFAYHSIMTAIFHFTQITPGWILDAGELYLQSARQGLSALVSMCLSSDKQGTVAFLHWTLLYYPLTACFILFCNAVATSHTGDFNLLKTVANSLIQSGTVSQPIATLQRLLQEFVSLSQCFFTEANFLTAVVQDDGATSTSVHHRLGSPAVASQFWIDGPVPGPAAAGQGMLLPCAENHPFSALDHILSQGDLGLFLGDADNMPPFSSA